MTTPLTPDEAKSWFGVLYSATEKSTPITLFFMLIVGVLFGWYLLKQMDIVRANSHILYDALIEAKNAQIVTASEYNRQLREVMERCRKE